MFNNNFNTPAIGNVFTNSMNGAKATLLLFTPKNFMDQVRRSVSYRFDGVALTKIGDRLSKVNTIGGFSNADAEMGAACAECVLPTAQGTPIDMRPFRDSWTFVLIIDSANAFSSLAGTTRTLYSGFVTGEPVSSGMIQSNLSTEYHHNPQAVFTTTHVTKLNSFPSAIGDMHGGEFVHQNTSLYDNDLLPGKVIQQTTASPNTVMCLLDPGTLIQNRRYNDYNYNSYDQFYNNAMNGADTYGVTPTPVESSADSIQQTASDSTPTKHLRKIVSGLADTIKHQGLNANTNEISDPLATWANSMPSANNVYIRSNQELDPSQAFLFDELDKKYPFLMVRVIKQPFNYQLNAIETGAPTRQNIAISIVAAALPGVLTNRLCTSVIASYCSWMPGDNPLLPGLLQINQMESFAPMDSVTYRNTAEVLKTDLINDIFAIVRANFGEFRCEVSCSVAGDTFVSLQLLDEMSNIDGCAVQCNNLGGINSCMVGDMTQSATNAGQLMTLASVVRSNPSNAFNIY